MVRNGPRYKQTALNWKKGASCSKQITLKCNICEHEFTTKVYQECGTYGIHGCPESICCTNCGQKQPFFAYPIWRDACKDCGK